MNKSWQTDERLRGYRFNNREGGGNQGDGQIDHGGLNARVTVGACIRLRFGLVVMEQAAHKTEYDD